MFAYLLTDIPLPAHANFQPPEIRMTDGNIRA
jgi:hypothetical protein